MSSRLFERLRAGKPAFGAFHLTSGTEMVEIMGRNGLDFVCVDMMITAIDWQAAAQMAVACRATRMTPMIRLASQPWSGVKNHHLPAEVERAFGIGYQSVMASLDSVEEIRMLVEAGRNRHHFLTWDRRFSTPLGESERRLDAELKAMEQDALVFPLIESKGAWDRLEDIMSIDGIQAVMLGMGDLSAALLGSDALMPGYRKGEADMLAIIETALALGKRKNVPVFANMYTRRDSFEAYVRKARWAWELGMPLIFLDFPSSIVSLFYGQMMDLMRREFNEVDPAAGAQ